jgi:glycosyltransferase involved in cell wall biosynthesis
LLLTGWHLKSYLQALAAAKRMGVPVLARGDSQLGTARSGVKRLVKALTYPPFLRQFNVALYVGKRSRAYYLHYGFPRDRLFFSPHSVDAAWFAERATETARQSFRDELGVADDVALALFAGKLVEFKRPDDLIRAVASLRQRGRSIEVLFAGDGALKGRLIALAEAIGVPAHFAGFRNQSEMPAVYAAADVLVLPSDSNETWGLVANEALACGRPIIVSDACGCSDDIISDPEGKRTGCVFFLGDIKALGHAIESVLDRSVEQASISAMSSRYSIANAVGGICAALASLESVH